MSSKAGSDQSIRTRAIAAFVVLLAALIALSAPAPGSAAGKGANGGKGLERIGSPADYGLDPGYAPADPTYRSSGATTSKKKGKGKKGKGKGKKKGKKKKVPKGAVRKLRKAGCPAPYIVRVQRAPADEKIRDARNGLFHLGGASVKVKPPHNWRADPVGSASYRARLHDLRWLDVLFWDYRKNDRLKSLRDAKNIVVDWVKNNPRARPSTDRTWFGKVVGDRTPYIAYVTRAAQCEGMLNKRLGRKLLESVAQHNRFLANDKNHPVANLGLFMDLGLVHSGKLIKFLPDAGKLRKLGERRFVSTVRKLTVPGEGMWLEHSTTYQFLVINVLQRFLSTRGIERPSLKKTLAQMKVQSGWLIMPDKRWLQAGDSYQDRADRGELERYKAAKGMRVLPKSGFAFVRKGKRYLSVLADFHNPFHKQSDELSFDLYDQKTRVVSDSGLYTKDPGPYFDFQESAEAHSTMTVDGQDFSRLAGDAYGSGILASGQGGGWFAIEATNPLVRPQGVDHRRMYLYRPGYALVIADRVRSDSTHNYRFRVQLGQKIRTDELDGGTVALSTNEGEIGFLYSDSTVPGEKLELLRGQTQPEEGFIFPDFRDRDRRWVAIYKNEAEDDDHLMTLSMKPNKQARAVLESSLDANPVRIRIDDVDGPVETLLIRRDGAKLGVEVVEPPEPPLPLDGDEG